MLRRSLLALAVIAAIAPASAEDPAPFDATGRLDCTFESMIEPATCDFGIRRGTGGTASVFVTTPTGDTRELVFAADGTVTVAGSETPAKLSRVGESTFVMIFSGAEVYRVPDAVLAGAP